MICFMCFEETSVNDLLIRGEGNPLRMVGVVERVYGTLDRLVDRMFAATRAPRCRPFAAGGLSYAPSEYRIPAPIPCVRIRWQASLAAQRSKRWLAVGTRMEDRLAQLCEENEALARRCPDFDVPNPFGGCDIRSLGDIL